MPSSALAAITCITAAPSAGTQNAAYQPNRSGRRLEASSLYREHVLDRLEPGR